MFSEATFSYRVLLGLSLVSTAVMSECPVPPPLTRVPFCNFHHCELQFTLGLPQSMNSLVEQFAFV